MRSVTSKRWVTSLALVAVLAACTGGTRLHGTREDLPGGNVVQMNLMTPTFGWVITDRRFVSTKDAGKTWNDLTPVDAPGNTIKGAFFLDQKRVWCSAVFGGTIDVYRSDSAGRAWRKTTLERDGTSVEHVAIAFADATHGWIEVVRAGQRSLHLSRDMGVTWGITSSSDEKQQFGSSLEASLRGHVSLSGFDLLSFADATHGWARKLSDKKLYATSDGAQTWTKLNP